MAAALACGPGAMISHLSAAVLWELLSSSRATVELTIPTGSRVRRPGLIVHRARRLHPEDRTLVDGIPVTALARTLADVAETVPRRLERAVEEAERRGLFDLHAIERFRGRVRGRHSLGALDAVIAESGTPVLTRSELERRFLALCRDFDVPPPAMNAMVEGFEVDAVWLEQRLVAEIDGHAFHKTRGQFERDRVRDAALQVAAFRVVRVTDRRLTGRSADVAATLAALLESGSPEGWQRGRMHRS